MGRKKHSDTARQPNKRVSSIGADEWRRLMTIAKLQLIRRLLLQLVAMVEAELCERGALQTINSRELPHW